MFSMGSFPDRHTEYTHLNSECDDKNDHPVTFQGFQMLSINSLSDECVKIKQTDSGNIPLGASGYW